MQFNTIVISGICGLKDIPLWVDVIFNVQI